MSRLRSSATAVLLSLVVVRAMSAAPSTYVYTNNEITGPNSVSAFLLNADGTLTQVNGSPFLTGGTGTGTGQFAANRITTVRKGSAAFVYVTNNNSGDVSAFSVDSSTGALTLIGAPVPIVGLPGNAMSVSASIDGNYLFAGGLQNITTFAIDGAGALTVKSSIAVASQADGLRVSPNGRFLAVAFPNRTSDSVAMYAINSDGSLTLAASFATPGDSRFMSSVEFDHSTSRLFVPESGLGGTRVDVFSIGTTGSLTPVTGSPFVFDTVGSNSNVAMLSSDEQFLFVTNQGGSGTVTVLHLTQVGGDLVVTVVGGSPFAGGGGQPCVGAVTHSGLPYLLTANFGSTVAVQAINPDDGTLAFKGAYQTPSGGGLESLAILEPAANTPPNVNAAADATAPEGTSTPFSLGSFTDDSSSPWNVTVDFGDGSAAETFTASQTGDLGTRNHIYADNGVFTLTVKVTDGEGLNGTATSNVTITNVAPTVNAPADQNGVEGVSSSFTLGSFNDPGADTWSGTVSWGDGTSNTIVFALQSLGSQDHTYADSGNYTVTLTVTDDDNGTGSAQFHINVANAAPVVSSAANQSSSEGSSTAFSLGSFTDVSTDSPWVVVVNWGDGSANDTFSVASAGSLGTRNHTYLDNGSYSVVVTVTDKDGGAGNASFTAAVANVAPAITDASVGPSPAHVTEGGSVTLTGSFTDPGVLDSHVVSINWGDGSTQTVNLAAGVLQFSASHVFVDNALVAVAFTVTDKDGGSAGGSMPLTVDNAAPVVTITAPDAGSLIPVNTNVTVTASFTDAGVADTHTCSVTWDNGDTTATTVGVVTESGGSGTCASSHVLSATGVYSITVTITDDDAGAGSANVLGTVFEPSTSGHVTGGGWFSSPAGAVVARPNVTGRANFGFVAKSDNGQLTGHTTFNVSAAQFRFESTSYDSLVVSGSKAQYRGSGKVTGSGDYGFLVTIYDGSPDRFRIKIWDKSNGNAVVYDNRMGVPDDIDNADPQPLGSGSIVIHN